MKSAYLTALARGYLATAHAAEGTAWRPIFARTTPSHLPDLVVRARYQKHDFVIVESSQRREITVELIVGKEMALRETFLANASLESGAVNWSELVLVSETRVI